VTECSKDEVGSHKEKVPTSLPCEVHKEQPSSTAADEIQLLDEILSRAQKLRAVQPPEVYSPAPLILACIVLSHS